MREETAFVSYFRNFIFGVEDSLVSTVGLLSGIAVVDTPARTIVLTGIVLIFVEAFSMAAGSFLSEQSAEGLATRREATSPRSAVAGVIMFFSYFIAGFVPLAPYLAVAPATALPYSIAFSLAALFLLGATGAKISGIRVAPNAIRMLAIGGVAIGVGVLVGIFVGNAG